MDASRYFELWKSMERRLIVAINEMVAEGQRQVISGLHEDVTTVEIDLVF